MFCCTLLYVPSSFAAILMGKRELVALLNLSSWCLMIVVWLFLAVPQGFSAVCDCGISKSYSLTVFHELSRDCLQYSNFDMLPNPSAHIDRNQSELHDKSSHFKLYSCIDEQSFVVVGNKNSSYLIKQTNYCSGLSLRF